MKWLIRHTEKPQTPSRILKDLEKAERLGNEAIQEVCMAAMKKENPNYNELLAWSKALLEGAYCAHCKNKTEQTGTYLFLYHNLWEYAKNHLALEEYHQFCGKQMDCWQSLYGN